MESPEVRIEDIIKTKLNQKIAIVDIEEMFLNICDKNSILVSGLSCNKQCLVSAKVFKNKIIVNSSLKDVEVVLRLSGIRKDRIGKRFTESTKEDMIKNNNFWRSWQ